MDRPIRLYKYRSLCGDGSKYAKATLVRRELYFSPLDDLNDPSEGARRLSWSGYADPRDSEGSTARGWATSTLQRLEEVKRDVGILCLSATRDDILMWSHYADRHRGVCFEFNAGHKSFDGVRKVEYSKTAPWVRNGHRLSAGDLAERMYLTKAAQWAYEREWRLVNPKRSGVSVFPSGVLTGVILGACISVDDEQRVKNWAAEAQRIQVYKAQLRPSSFQVFIEPDD